MLCSRRHDFDVSASNQSVGAAEFVIQERKLAGQSMRLAPANERNLSRCTSELGAHVRDGSIR
jgi:hypothetical protein